MIHIAQVLCPQRHYILLLAFDPAKHSDQWAIDCLRRQMDLLVPDVLARRCGICASAFRYFEIHRTRFTSLKQAANYVADCLRDQRRTLVMFEMLDPERN